ncbi:MAG: DNA polymerase III subunit beta [Syntrophorhabdales bacterium]|jgi:DNA polymerase III sliding clamp (beta) subunit (PCNA family)
MKKEAGKKRLILKFAEGLGSYVGEANWTEAYALRKAQHDLGIDMNAWEFGERTVTAKSITVKVVRKVVEVPIQPEPPAVDETETSPTVERYYFNESVGQFEDTEIVMESRMEEIAREEPASEAYEASFPPGFTAQELLTGVTVAGGPKAEDTFTPVLVTLPLKETVAALKIAVDIASGKNIMPILRNIRIEAIGDKAAIQVTDLEKAWSGTIPSEGGPIVSCVPALVLLKEIQALPAGTEKVELLFRGSTASHSTVSVNGRCDIVTQDPEEYPEIKPAAGAWPECRNFLDGLKRVMPAVSVDQTRYALTGVYLDFKESKIVGTDGFRMHVEDITPADASMPPAIIPLDSCKVIAKHGTVNAIGWLDEKHIACPMGCGVFSTQVIEGTYPDWKNVMPRPENIVTFRRDEFLNLFAGASIIEKERLTLTVNGELVIESEGHEGTYKWHIPCGAVMKKEGMTLHFNGRFLFDAIRSFPLEEVVLKAPDTYGACLLNGKAVVMPIRV